MATYTATADASGNFEVDFDQTYDGGQAVKITATKNAQSKTINLNAPSAFVGIEDSDIKTWNGQTQEEENKTFNRSKLGNKIYLEHLSSSIDAGGSKFPQGACAVGDSIFVKIANNIGTVGESTEQFIIVEYNFNTGAKIAETSPIATLGHHMLSGFSKDGKTYLVTSYEPSSDTYNRSGVGVSLIEWKGASTTISDVTQWELLNKNQRIGAPCVDEKGEYIYLVNYYKTLTNADNTSSYVEVTNSNVQVHKLSDLKADILRPLYSFDIENPTSDGWSSSATFNGLSANGNHLYTVNSGSYSNTTISKHTVFGELIERIAMGGTRSSRPYSSRITNTTFLYNSECEDIFTKDNKTYMMFAETWFGVGEFVRYNGQFYMARYGMTGRAPDTNVNYWEKVFFTPSSYTEYSNTTAYVGRNTSVSDFKRVIVEVALKDDSNLDLLSENANVIPNIVNNAQGKVHYFGSLATSKELNFGQYNVEQGSFQMNLSIIDNGLRLFDTRTPSLNSTKNSQVLSYKTPTVNNMSLVPDADYSTDAFRVYGRYHNDSTNTTPFGYLARFENNGVETSIFHRDGRFYTYTTNATVTVKFINNSVEALSVYNGSNMVMLDTANTYMWFGKSASGAHSSATIGINHDTRTMYPASNGSAALGMSNQRFSKAWLQNLNVGSLVVYADNAAAKAGGLANGEVYRTDVGALMVVF